MSALTPFRYAGTVVVSSEAIAEGSGVEHRAVLQLIHANLSDFEDFGQVAFEMRAGYNNAQVRVALLNEQQATLLMTFQRNTEQVRSFKKALVRAFFDMAREVVPPAEMSRLEILQFALESEQRAVQLEAKVAIDAPKVQAWDELASADGDYEVADAAKILARAGIETGQARLFKQLADLGWIFRGSHGKWKAFQTAVDAGYLAEKPMSHYHPKTGAVVLDPPQVRVTVRGLERLRVRLGSLDLAVVA
ncbi:phage antirepressor KilAC domain-containing protein [Glaciibacter psychrotolerans]|uniref:Phage regulator Rha-like protein n=1 Tax=Glaciibacter psychrotolerans TaxID=670054 RepID=A0A7Z0EDF9_9MICO|nr:phage regulatory protein/antirepressor Ant [Leifsonia psychrotolerans]NYJ19150.1 phage regulator Rha-like protein [Leifsonia psychrotolerans]